MMMILFFSHTLYIPSRAHNHSSDAVMQYNLRAHNHSSDAVMQYNLRAHDVQTKERRIELSFSFVACHFLVSSSVITLVCLFLLLLFHFHLYEGFLRSDRIV
jgi:hypothetical protein